MRVRRRRRRTPKFGRMWRSSEGLEPTCNSSDQKERASYTFRSSGAGRRNAPRPLSLRKRLDRKRSVNLCRFWPRPTGPDDLGSGLSEPVVRLPSIEVLRGDASFKGADGRRLIWRPRPRTAGTALSMEPHVLSVPRTTVGRSDSLPMAPLRTDVYLSQARLGAVRSPPLGPLTALPLACRRPESVARAPLPSD